MTILSSLVFINMVRGEHVITPCVKNNRFQKYSYSFICYFSIWLFDYSL